MNKKIFLFLLVQFVVFTSFSQKKTLYGKIKDSLNVVYNAHIVNLNSKLGTTTAEDGTFKTQVIIGDTLLISSIQHLEKKYIIQKSSLGFKGLVIYLQPKIYELDEFDLKRHTLIGSLGIDLNSVPTRSNPEVNAISLGLPNAGLKKMKKVDREIYAATSSSLDFIFSALSGRLKKLKEKKKIIEEDTDVNIMFSKFKYYLTQDFNIHKEDTYRFLYFCRTDSLFNKKILSDEFVLIKFLKQKSKEFNKLRKE